ncbi:hypothetical protein AXG93_441s1180 [Marchantia polymorpha subsp. ruderalis]|uniref:Uncharacterized protein n=1 Tax=Marchantia polymorpha subsp. ruderalis TaxID=1480154 RepID=A0A176W2R9_MARPO|nr:hypothetical protein AXG93_441s1180 [Marchantia polymorpha subsp. ruderalis]
MGAPRERLAAEGDCVSRPENVARLSDPEGRAGYKNIPREWGPESSRALNPQREARHQNRAAPAVKDDDDNNRDHNHHHHPPPPPHTYYHHFTNQLEEDDEDEDLDVVHVLPLLCGLAFVASVVGVAVGRARSSAFPVEIRLSRLSSSQRSVTRSQRKWGELRSLARGGPVSRAGRQASESDVLEICTRS